jgi:tetratricopeptide (TPR) repeat protein
LNKKKDIVEKEKILDLLKNPTKITRDDIYLFEKWVHKFPYFQTAHVVIAKIANDLKIPNKEVKLNYAAIYSPSRVVLKQLVQNDWSKVPTRKSSSVLPSQSAEKVNENAPNKPAESYFPPINNFQETEKEDWQVKNEHYNQKLKDDYLIKREQYEIKQEQREQEEQKEEIPAPTINHDLVNEVLANLEKAKRLKKEFLDRENDDTQHVRSTYTPPNQDTSFSYQERSYHSENQERNAGYEQKELIDNFIEKEKSIGKIEPTDNSSSPVDLSERSTYLSDDMVSENLASILCKQGKKDKAIDIYKKLIWKFPQKRAYFASLIEELKNN